MSDNLKNYYVFKYIVDAITKEPTEHEGEIQAFVKATDPWDAVTKSGLNDDMNIYGANRIDNLSDYVKSIKNEYKLLRKINKQLKTLIDEEKAIETDAIKNHLCPNGCGKLNKKNICNACGYGHPDNTIVITQ